METDEEVDVRPPDSLRCGRSDGKQWRCSHWRIEGKSLCEKHYLQSLTKSAKRAKGRVPQDLANRPKHIQSTTSANKSRKHGHSNKRKTQGRGCRRSVTSSGSEAESEEFILKRKRPSLNLASNGEREHSIGEVNDEKATKSPSHELKKQSSVSLRARHLASVLSYFSNKWLSGMFWCC